MPPPGQGDPPRRFAARLLPAGEGPVLDANGFRHVNERVFGAVFDRATGQGAWTFGERAEDADRVLVVWAERQAEATRAGNPYEPRWKDPAKLTPAQRDDQAKLMRQRTAELREKGSVEAEKRILALRDKGALFVVSHSGGKDSQAMAVAVSRLVPERQILWVHAPLHGVEWAGIIDQVRRYKPSSVPLVFAEAVDKEGEEKWLLEWVLRRGMWPSKGQRWCTSDFKRGPIRREIRRHADAQGFTIIVEAIGLRAEESSDRAEQPVLKPLAGEHGTKGRQWYVWLPLKWASTQEVFDVITSAKQEPMWTYLEGMSRASCAFCVLASQSDLRRAAELAPDLYAAYVAVEQYIGHTIRTRKARKDEDTSALRKAGKLGKDGSTVLVGIEEVTGVAADPKLVLRYLQQVEKTGELRDIPVAGARAYAEFQRGGKRAAGLRVLPSSTNYGQMEIDGR